MRLVDDWYLQEEWPDPEGAKYARARLVLYLCDRFAELIEWGALRCDADGDPLTDRQRAALLAAGAMLLHAESLPAQPRND